MEMTKKGMGMTGIVDAEQRIVGIYTDGDLRRTLEKGVNVHDTRIGDVMTRNPKTARADMLAEQAPQIMQRHKVGALIIVDDDNRVTGAINMQALLRAGVV